LLSELLWGTTRSSCGCVAGKEGVAYGNATQTQPQ
jgi:hypothetical protein